MKPEELAQLEVALKTPPTANTDRFEWKDGDVELLNPDDKPDGWDELDFGDDDKTAEDKGFNENEIVRVPAGQEGGGEFASKGGSTGASKLEPAHADREQWPEHVKAAKIPPAWKGVEYDRNPDADLIAVGRDAKGRRQAVYSAKFHAKQAEAKFSRVDELAKKFDSIVAQNRKNGESGDELTKEHADIVALIMQMGIRPGSETDRGGKSKAYGATTLEGRHVQETTTGVWLRFIGKKGVKLSLKVPDPKLAADLKARAAKAGHDGQLFPEVSDGSLLEYVHSLDGGGFKTKDFRTHLGTKTAMAEVAKVKKPPANEKEYKKAVKAVATKVSGILGNTPTIALQSYINPVVFAQWRTAASQGGSGVPAPVEHMHALFSKITKPDGGFTYQPLTDQEPKAGFAVSPYPDRSFAKPAQALKFADLVGYAKKNKDLLKQQDHYIGAWHDPDSGTVYLDVSVMADDEAKAAKLALEKDQIAYFDLAHGKSVTVNKSATSGGAAGRA